MFDTVARNPIRIHTLHNLGGLVKLNVCMHGTVMSPDPDFFC